MMVRDGENLQQLTRGLGWFSLALGVTELLAPSTLNRALGARPHDGLVRSYGLREVIAGLGLLSNRNPSAWAWARVAGDAVDLASLLSALSRRNRDRIVPALLAVGAVTALDFALATSVAQSRADELRQE